MIGVARGARPAEQTGCYSRAENLIRIRGAVNEVVPFQFVLTAEAAPATGLEVRIEDFLRDGGGAPIAAERCALYRVWPVRVERFPNWYLRSQGFREPRDIADVLVPVTAPRHGQPYALSVGESMPIWIEVSIPPDARPGNYRSHVVVRDGYGRQSRSPVELTVFDLRLPLRPRLTVLAGVQLAPILTAHAKVDAGNLPLALRDEDALRALRTAFNLLHAHGLSPYTAEVYPAFAHRTDGTIEVDWSSYDAACGPWIDGTAYADGREAAAWPVPADLSQPDPSQYYGLDSAVYAAMLRRYLGEVARHFDEKGWIGRSFIQFDLPREANPGADVLNQVRKLAVLTDLVDRRIPFVSTLAAQPMRPFGWFDHSFQDLSGHIDIWSTPARYRHQRTMEQQRVLGKRTWLLPDRPPFSGSMAVEAPRVHARSLAWQAFLQGDEAVILPRTTAWPADVIRGPIQSRDQATDTWLLYPGREFGLSEPVPSVRLKQLRQGIQDFEYLSQLEIQGRGETARLAAGSLIKASGTDTYGDNYQDGLFGRRVEDPEIWHLAREIIADELVHASKWAEPSADGEEAEAAPTGSRAAWQRFLSGTRALEVWSESVRLTVDPRPDQVGHLVTFGIAVRNEYRTPIEGRLGFGLLPPEWRSVSDAVTIGPLGEMQYARQVLTASSEALPRCDLDGHAVQTIVLDAGPAGRCEAGALLSVVRVPRAPRPITLDGNLGDWPPTEANVAGDFRTINNFARAGSQRPSAQSQTLVYFCREGRTLYIGVHAAKPAGVTGAGAAATEGPGLSRRGNVVIYEDLMPVGEDLVEILLDPSNSATLSEDLCHIVLKSSGQAVFERGIGLSPPIGGCRPWAVQARYMVEDGPTAWSAEVAIPLEAFGPEAMESPIWGMNVARLEPVRGEYSDWAGAPRYCYDPRSLGNLVWLE